MRAASSHYAGGDPARRGAEAGDQARSRLALETPERPGAEEIYDWLARRVK